MENTKLCKCCGAKRELFEFDKSNSGKPIGICKVCRRHQQRITNLSKMDPTKMSVSQHENYTASLAYMKDCKEATGFETGKYSSRIGYTGPTVAPSAVSLKEKYAAAQKHREALESSGVVMSKPTLELLTKQSVEFLVDCGYTAKECYDVIDAEVNKDSDLFTELDDKFYAFPR